VRRNQALELRIIEEATEPNKKKNKKKKKLRRAKIEEETPKE
jgi:hypothetical protein